MYNVAYLKQPRSFEKPCRMSSLTDFISLDDLRRSARDPDESNPHYTQVPNHLNL